MSGADFEKTLYFMITSGKFYQTMSWVAGVQGKALKKRRANAIWKAMVSPMLVDYLDIQSILFKLALAGAVQADNPG